MKKIVFEGSCVATVTPFLKDGIDFDKLGELIEFQISEGTDSILTCGTTGEYSTMTDDEQKETIKFTVEKVNKRVPVIAGTGSNNTKHAIELTQYAEQVGADAILSVNPYYNKTTQRGLYQHFKAIAESIKIPIILYNVPSRTNLNINADTIINLSKIDNIVGIKECNFSQVGEVLINCDNSFSVYSGDDHIIVPFLSLGGRGVISVLANITPKPVHKMVKSYLSGDTETAKKLQLEYLKLSQSLFLEVSPTPVKQAMNLMGMNVGECRMPLIEMDSKNIETLKNILSEYGLLKK